MSFITHYSLLITQHKHRWLFLILGLSLLLRLISLTHHDAYTDETLLAFRAIGMIDYDAALIQTTPWQWFEAVPWWARLSMHDHPILFFLIEHWSMTLLGVNLIAARLPAVLAGVGSVWLMYLIGNRLKFTSKTIPPLVGEGEGGVSAVGLLAAALLAVSSYHIWVSRVGLQESVVILLMLATLWFVLKAREDDQRWWLAAGAALGLGIITKYTIFIIVPIILWYALVYRWKLHRERAFWWACLIAFIVATPSWLYNLKLYQTRGHFDFQISAFLNQDVPEWSVRFGRTLIGGPKDRAVNFFRALYQSNSPVFNGLALASLMFFVVSVVKKYYKKYIPPLVGEGGGGVSIPSDRTALFLLGIIILFFLWFLVIGSTYRFVAMVVPMLALLIASLCNSGLSGLISRGEPVRAKSPELQINYERRGLIFVAILIAYEIFYSVNSFLLTRPLGSQNIAYAQVNEETQNFGFNQLESYLTKLLNGKMPKFAGTPEYQFIAEAQNTALARFQRQGREPYPILIIYEKDLNFLASLWIFTRRLIYEGWPVISDADFVRLTGAQYDQFYRAQGVEKFVYIAAADDRVIRPAFDQVGRAEGLLKYLTEKRIEPMVIRNRAGEEAFWVYEF